MTMLRRDGALALDGRTLALAQYVPPGMETPLSMLRMRAVHLFGQMPPRLDLVDSIKSVRSRKVDPPYSGTSTGG